MSRASSFSSRAVSTANVWTSGRQELWHRAERKGCYRRRAEHLRFRHVDATQGDEGLNGEGHSIPFGKRGIEPRSPADEADMLPLPRFPKEGSRIELIVEPIMNGASRPVNHE